MLGLAKELPKHDEMYELHRLLGALLSKELTINEKLTIIGNEYDIPVEENFRRDVNISTLFFCHKLFLLINNQSQKESSSLYD